MDRTMMSFGDSVVVVVDVVGGSVDRGGLAFWNMTKAVLKPYSRYSNC